MINGQKLTGAKLQSAFEGTLARIYPKEFEQASSLAEVPAVNSSAIITRRERIDQPLVYIPVFPGTNSEYDSTKAFEKEGARVDLVPFLT